MVIKIMILQHLFDKQLPRWIIKLKSNFLINRVVFEIQEELPNKDFGTL